MGRLLFFGALALLVYWVIKSWQRKQDEPEPVERTKKESIKNKKEESVLQCRHCGAYSPLDLGVMLEGRFYCNLDHARASGEKVN